MAIIKNRHEAWALVPFLSALVLALVFPKALVGGNAIPLAVLFLEWVICLLWLVYLRRAHHRATFWCEARR